MNMPNPLRAGLLACLLAAPWAQAAAPRPLEETPVRVTYVARDDFDTVKTLIEEALVSRGLVVNNVAHIGDMLERTGKDLGASRQVYTKAEGIEFCSATVSRKMMEADPHNIVFCPYVISIYVLPNEPGKTYVSFRRLQMVGSKQSQEALKDVEKLLRDIVKEALQ
ncbi:DUF302 domain-containing protein [Thiobacter aerophilum]|uniref:DUF302 domain-containing protein n=1 Tax=Thiobacter aerophilum TaxID=3121275 RepID=A0ABV0EEG3_9BURK